MHYRFRHKAYRHDREKVQQKLFTMIITMTDILEKKFETNLLNRAK